MTFVTCDIETVPQARYVDPEQFEDPERRIELEENYREGLAGEMGILATEIRQGQAVLATTRCVPSLHATTCHVAQVSFGLRKQNGEIERRIFQWDDYLGGLDLTEEARTNDQLEALVLTEAFKLLHWAGSKSHRIVTFNGKQFDLPILRARAAILKLDVPRLSWAGTKGLLYPYSDETHCDIRLVLGAGDRRAAGTLQAWADAFGIHAEEHGAEVWGWVQAGKWDELRKYGNTEAQTLVEMYERIRSVL